MAIEIEKKYRLHGSQEEAVVNRLKELGAHHDRDDFEENFIYRGETLLPRSVLRLRRVNGTAILTYKERFPSSSDIKHQREDETVVNDPDALHSILKALGFTVALVYEKRRQRWRLGTAEVVLDELPFGVFMEIEAGETEIRQIEERLAIEELRVETDTYPQLTLKHGTRRGDVIEARFKGA